LFQQVGLDSIQSVLTPAKLFFNFLLYKRDFGLPDHRTIHSAD
jgi:hypothetical protein